jgi:hypothetical protein
MSKNFIEKINLYDTNIYDIVPSKVKKTLLDQEDNNSYKCKPLNVANTYGWDVLCPFTFTAHWNGGNRQQDITIECYDESICVDCSPMVSHFGFGTLTFNMDFIIRTNENISLYVRSPINTYIEGVQPLDAIVETDWLPYTFTYNFKFPKPGKASFVKGEPLYTFFPIERGFIESFDLKSSNINMYPELQDEFEHYNDTRSLSNSQYGENKPDSVSGFYTRGENSMRKKYNIKNHAKTTILKYFKK